MARTHLAIWTLVVFGVAFATLGGAPGFARQPLPTPHGQLGGREPLEPTRPTGIEVLVTPASRPAVPDADNDGHRSTRIASMASVAARSTVAVRTWRGDAPSEAAGWLWDASGHVVTASAAVEAADRIEAAAADGVWLDARIVGMVRADGIAVLVAPGLGAPPLDLPRVRARPGDPVAAAPPAFRRGDNPVWTFGTVQDSHSAGVGFAELDPGAAWWLPGAPVVGETGLVGMALPAIQGRPATATAEPSPGAPVRYRAGQPAAYVPIETVSESVVALIGPERHPGTATIPTPGS